MGGTRFLRGLKDTARVQLGTSGSGNHFVEFGAFSVPEDLDAERARVLAPLEAGRSYLALLSHSGSRGVGNKIATRYSRIAEERRSGLEGEAQKLAWLELASEEGQEYRLSMPLAGRFAAALVSTLGACALAFSISVCVDGAGMLEGVCAVGMPAAPVMATTCGIVRAVAQSSNSPGAVLGRVDDLLSARIPPNTFVTCFYALLDPETCQAKTVCTKSEPEMRKGIRHQQKT